MTIFFFDYTSSLVRGHTAQLFPLLHALPPIFWDEAMDDEKAARGTIEPSDRIRWSERHISAQVGGQIVLLSLSQGNYCGLDDIASDIWQRIQHPVTVASLYRDLERSYAAEPGVIARDVLALLTRMHEQGLIDLVE